MEDIQIYNNLPAEALAIRLTVFVDEQGFVDEVDECDAQATHLVLLREGKAVATCRIYPVEGVTFMMGRLAVLAPYRGKGLGSALLGRAEEAAREKGGKVLKLHAQLHARGFYEACGYEAYGEIKDEQGSPHIWMRKKL